MVIRRNAINEIIRDLRSKNKARINRGIQKIATLVMIDGDETHEKIRKAGAKPSVYKLLKKLLHLCNDDDWETRYAAMRGLREIPNLAFDRGSLDRIIHIIYWGILDEDGRVRWAAVQTLERFRASLPDELYVKTYLKLREMHEQQTGRVRRSIGHAIEKMDSLHLRTLLKTVVYAHAGAYTDELAEALRMEEVRRALRGLIEELRESNLRRRLKMKSTPVRPDTPLEEVLSRYNKNALEGMGKILQLPPPVTGLKKRELVEKICSHLFNLELIERVVESLRREERLALLDLMLKNSLMLWAEFALKHGDDLEESTYWKWHPPKTIMGRLKARGLIAEGSFEGKDWILIPQELRPLLEAVQKQSEALDKSTIE